MTPRNLPTLVIILFYLPMPAYSQRVMFGVKVAGQATRTFQSPSVPDVIHEDRIVFGPVAEVRLWRRVSLEVDGLYKKKLDYTQNMIFPDPTQFRETFVTTDVTSRAWEIPVITKWRVFERSYSVFVGGGFSSRKVTGSTHTYGTTVSLLQFPPTIPTTFDTRTSLANPWTFGPVFTAGLDTRAGIFHFQPELRYTRWNDSPFFISTNLNAVQLSIGIAVGK
jgi:hypothetical protein